MTIVKELNELAKKMTGTNPKATTDAQAMDFIEQNYQNDGGNEIDLYIDLNFINRYISGAISGNYITIENEEDLAKAQAIESAVNKNNKTKVNIHFDNQGSVYNFYGMVSTIDGKFDSLTIEYKDTSTSTNVLMTIISSNGQLMVGTNIYSLTPYSA